MRNRWWLAVVLSAPLALRSISALAGIILGTDFTAGSGSSFAPPDTDGSVGTNDYAQFINGRFAVYNKSNGSQRLAETDTAFWNAAGIPAATTNVGLSDTRIVFDPSTSRWFATEINVVATNTQVLIGRSDTVDPAGTWHAANYTGNSGFSDYPTLGVDANGVYIGTVDFTDGTANGTNKSVSMTSIPKSDLLLAAPSVAQRTTFEQTNYAMGYVLEGVTNFAPTATHATVVSTNASGFGKLNLTRITNTGAANATLSPTTVINVQATTDPGQAHQPDGTQQIDGIDDRIGGVTYQVGDKIYVVHGLSVNAAGVATATAAGTTDAIRLTILSDSSKTVIAEGTYFNAGYDYIFPSVAANGNGDIVIGFTRSSATQGSGLTTGNLSGEAVYANLSNTNVITFGNELQLQAGQVNNYHLFGGAGERWGDFSQTTLDPANSNAFWTTQEYAVASGTWGTSISQVLVPEPSSLALMAVGVLALMGRSRRAGKPTESAQSL